jgi:DNA modification methylase
MKTETIATWTNRTELVPWEDNPRINEHVVQEIADSIRRWGWTNPILARRENNMVIAGHTRLKAAEVLGLTEVPVRFLDVDPVEARLLAIADNKLGERATWDDDLLRKVLSDHDIADLDGLGFELEELEQLLADPGLDNPDMDMLIPPPSDFVHSKLGEVYELGPHRLMCGDSTDPYQVSILMDGDMADLVVTDPPYNVAMGFDATVESQKVRGRRKDGKVVANDSMSDEQFHDFLVNAFSATDGIMKPGCSYYIWHSDSEGYNFRSACMAVQWKVRQCLIWAKQQLIMGRQDYQWKHEPCLYGWKDGAGHNWYSDRKQTTLLEFDRPSRSEEHPTMKPIELILYQIKNSSKLQDIVYDPFGGSGTTLLASAIHGAHCRTMELMPMYCDVIRRRWTEFAKEHGLEIGSGGLESE